MVNCRVLTLKRKKNVNYQLSLTGFDIVNHELNMIIENWQILPNMSPLLYFIWFSGQNCHPTSAFLIYVPFKYDSKYFINISQLSIVQLDGCIFSILWFTILPLLAQFYSPIARESYLIFVIFFTRAKFLENKFTPKKRVNYVKIHRQLPIFCVITAKYTVNCQFFALNL